MIDQFRYSDRHHAGKILAAILVERQLIDPVVLALPRGGVPVANIIADTLHVPLDVLIVRKIGAPFNPEYGIGAMCEDLIPLFNAGELLPFEDLEEAVIEIVQEEKAELKRRIQHYRGGRDLPEVKNKNVILVDDGLATGVSAAAAGKFLKSKGARKIYLVVPVGPQSVSDLLRANIDEIICPYKPMGFHAIGSWYKNFDQVSDEEVMSVLRHYHPDTDLNFL
jgi:putative phosphoribosyl transferase